MAELTEEQTMLQDMLARFLTAAPDDPWKELAELGVIGALFPEQHGGFGGGGSDIAIVFEQIGRAANTAPLIDCALLPGLLLAAADHNIDALVSAEVRYAVAHAEPDARYDLQKVEARIDNGFISGEKTVVVGAAQANQIIVSARNDNDIGLYTISANAPEIRFNHYELAQGGHAADLLLSSVPAQPLLSNAVPAIETAWAAALVAQSADTLGAMDYVSELTRDYLKTREQFGRPLSSFQALAHRITDIMIAMEQARSAVTLAASHLDSSTAERDKYAAACKNLMGRSGRLVAEECVQLHGGIGMTDEYTLGQYVKRIIMADHRFGDTDFHMERYIALSNLSTYPPRP